MILDNAPSAAAARYDKWWDGLSPSEQDARRARNRDQKRSRFAEMSSVEKEQQRERQRLLLSNLPKERRAERILKQRQWWDELTTEERAAKNEKYKEQHRGWYARLSPEEKKRRRERQRARFHGCTIEQVHDLLEAQGGRCAGCQIDKPKKNGWHIDHDHTTGKIRGILCGPCNMALGLLKDNPDTLRRLAVYVA